MSIIPIATNELNKANLELNLKDIEISDSSSTNNNHIFTPKKENKLVNKRIDRFGDLTEIIKKNVIKTLLDNNKAYSNKKNQSVLLTLSSSKKQKNKQNNINIITNANSSTKTSSQNSLNSNNIKHNSKINPELFVNKKPSKNKNNSNIVGKKEFSIEKKKFDFNSVLNRFEEEMKKTKKRFEAKKEKIKEQEKQIFTGKPNISKSTLKKYEKYSKDFLIRQKELNEALNKKKKKFIHELNQKKEEEYQKIISDNILNKKKKNYIRSKSCDDWVERLYKEDTKKRKMEKYYLEQTIIPSFQPFIPKKNINKIMNKNKNRINKVIKEYIQKTNPQVIINYLNTNQISENQNEALFRNKIFGKSTNKYINKKINNSMEQLY